jgi:YbbR domain-containing protein
LFNNIGMILLALVLAIVVWIVAVQEENPIVEGAFEGEVPIVIRNQPAQTTFLPEAFAETVEMRTIRAPQSSWRDLRADKFTAWIDLAGKESGEFQVPVHVQCIDENVRIIEISPANVPIRLRREISSTVPVQIRLFGAPSLGYEFGAGQVSPEQVTIVGPESLVAEVVKATVNLDLRDRKETFVGTRRLDARRADDELITWVDIQPPTVQITIPVVQELGSNEVAVRAVVSGTVAPGYWVAGVTVDPPLVTLLGDPEAVAEIQGFVNTLPLDISGARGNIVERMPLDLPEQVSTLGVQGVIITVQVEAQPGNITLLREPVIRGLGTGLVATVTPAEVAVALTGPLPRIQSLTDEDVFVYVDLVDKGIGQHRIPLTSLVPEGLEVLSLLPEFAEVSIAPIPPTPTPTWTPTMTPTPTPEVTGTIGISGTPGITGTVTVTGTPGARPRGTASPTPTPSGTPTPSPLAAATPAPIALTPTPVRAPESRRD